MCTFLGQATILGDRLEILVPADPEKQVAETLFNVPLSWSLIQWEPV